MAVALGRRVMDYVVDYLDQLASEPALHTGDAGKAVAEMVRAPGEKPGDLDRLLAALDGAARTGVNTASGGYLAYFPSGGLTSSALGELLALTLNRYPGYASIAPGLVAMEHGVIRWLCDEFGLPTGAGGLVMTGGSMATLPAVVAARDNRGQGLIYVGEHTHHCIAKAAHIAGMRDRVRIIPSTSDFRLDVSLAARMVAEDRAAGLRPMMLVATAGATSTGLVDPLDDLGQLARREDLWFHVDGAYGAPYQLTSRGRERLAGIELADSIVLDPHKSLFLPYGTGMLLVRNERTLHRAHAASADYLQDLDDFPDLPDFATLGPELSRESRGPRIWLPLHLHGVAAFREALDEKIDLARWVYDELRREPSLELPWTPDLTVVGFRKASGNRELLHRIHSGGEVFLSSTRIGGRFTLRLCPQSLRTHAAEAESAVRVILSEVRG